MKKSNVLFVFIALLATVAFIGLSAEGASAEKAAEITDGSRVKIHYTLTVDGKEVDSSRDGEPMDVTVGSKQVIPGFEKALIGMKVGDKKTFKVKPKEGYGEVNPDAFQEVAKNRMPEGLELEEGMTLSAQGQDGQRYPVKVEKIKKDVVVMNFNHPLAGKTLKFDVEIVSVN